MLLNAPMSASETVTGAPNTFHSTISEQGGVVNDPF
jgi:hypothetical protein